MLAARAGSLALLTLVVGCADPSVGFGIATNAIFDGTIDDATIARVTELEIVASGDETFTQPLPLGRAAHRSERFVYRPSQTSRSITLQIFALDASSTVLAAGHSATIALVDGKTSTANITLDAMEVPDGGVDFAVADLSGFDLSGPDLAGADLYGVDLYTGVIPPSGCAALTAADNSVFCASFDNAASTLSGTSNFGSTTIDTTHAFRGAASMHIHTESGHGGMTKSAEQSYGQIPLFAMYATRAFYYMNTPPPKATRIIDIQQGAPPYSEITALLDATGMLDSDIETTKASVAGATPVAFPMGRWVCLEMRITWGDALGGHVKYYMDDVELPSLAYNGATNETPALDYAIYGQYNSVGVDAGWDMWIDEAMVASSPIGCTK